MKRPSRQSPKCSGLAQTLDNGAGMSKIVIVNKHSVGRIDMTTATFTKLKNGDWGAAVSWAL